MHKKLLHFATFLFLLLAFIPAQVFAAGVNKEGAEHLRTMFQNLLDKQQNIQKELGQAEFVYEGEITVEPAGKYYAVTLPQTEIHYKDGRIFKFGIIAVNAAPHDKEGQWKMTMALPTPMVMTGGDMPDVTINIGRQQAAGLWDEALGNFVKLDAQYSDITAQTSDNVLNIKIAGSDIDVDYKQGPDGKYSGQANVGLNGFEIKTLGEHVKSDIKIGKLGYVISFKDFDHALWKTLSAPAEGKNILDTYLKPEVLQILDAASSTYTLENLSYDLVKTGEEPGQNAAHKGRLKFGQFGIAIQDIQQEKARALLNISFEKTPAASPENAAAVDKLQPSKADINIAFENIPLKQTLGLVQTEAQRRLALPTPMQEDTIKMANMVVMFQALGLISTAETTIKTDSSMIGSDIYDIQIRNAAFTANPQSANKITGTAQVVFTGVEAVETYMQEVQKAPGTLRPEAIQLGMDRIAFIKEAGRLEKLEDGRDAYIFDIELTADGRMLANGKDMRGGASAPAPAPVPAPGTGAPMTPAPQQTPPAQ